MLYTDLFFVFLFLPVAVLVSFFDKSPEYKNFALILASLVFFTWGRPILIALLFVTVIFDWLFGLAAERAKHASVRFLAAFADFGMNAAFFVVFGWNGLFHAGELFGRFSFLSFSDKLIPIGITIYTLRGFSYVFDVYAKRIPAEKNFFCLLTYMVNLPLMVMGPVVRYGDLSAQIRHRQFTSADFSAGLTRFILGLGKITIVATALGSLKAAGLDTGESTVTGAWLGFAAFIGQFYYTYTGYTDLALGMGKLFGFTLPENFAPITARSYFTGMISSFNTKLVDLARDVLLENRFAKQNKALRLLALIPLCAFLALWYQFSRHMLVAAAIAVFFLINEALWLKKFLDARPAYISGIYSVVAVSILFAAICFPDFHTFTGWFSSLLNIGTDYTLSVAVKYTFLSNLLIYMLAAVYAILPLRRKITQLFRALALKNNSSALTLHAVYTVALCGILLYYAATTLLAL